METINRILEEKIFEKLIPNKVIVITGARRVGKTTLLKQMLGKINEPYLFLNGEDFTVAELLSNRTIHNYKKLLENNKLIIIDEAQKINNIGLILKLMVDEIDGLRIIVTGSSAFDISNVFGEPLTGRKIDFCLYPLSELELSKNENIFQRKENLKQRLVFGNYPELTRLHKESEKAEYLKEIVSSYLLKDILIFENIRNSSKILNLLRLVAFQIGNEVSYQELGQKLAMSKNTVEKYLDLLSKVFVLYKLEGFSRNLRKEISKSSKWYFHDNGIRNILIANLNPVDIRNDTGVLWENYIISERLKCQEYNKMIVNNYFWRTYDKQEIDWIEEREGSLFAYEMKWKDKKIKAPAAWKNTYKESTFNIITPDNYFSWLT